MKILIIEDDLELREELKVLLDNNGYQGIILKDFKNALEEILVIDPDLILLDIKIPFLNGQQLLKKLREKSTIPVIMVTSKDSEIDEILALSYVLMIILLNHIIQRFYYCILKLFLSDSIKLNQN